jgi:PadR family transcriptional regulator PadR
MRRICGKSTQRPSVAILNRLGTALGLCFAGILKADFRPYYGVHLPDGWRFATRGEERCTYQTVEYSFCMTTSEMREPTFLIMAALAEGKRHGYRLIQSVRQHSGGRVTLQVGTLYSVLERLQTTGLVAAAGEEVVDGRLRRYYELTDEGVRELSEQISRMERNIRQAKTQLALRASIGGLA